MVRHSALFTVGNVVCEGQGIGQLQGLGLSTSTLPRLNLVLNEERKSNRRFMLFASPGYLDLNGSFFAPVE